MNDLQELRIRQLMMETELAQIRAKLAGHDMDDEMIPRQIEELWSLESVNTTPQTVNPGQQYMALTTKSNPWISIAGYAATFQANPGAIGVFRVAARVQVHHGVSDPLWYGWMDEFATVTLGLTTNGAQVYPVDKESLWFFYYSSGVATGNQYVQLFVEQIMVNGPAAHNNGTLIQNNNVQVQMVNGSTHDLEVESVQLVVQRLHEYPVWK